MLRARDGLFFVVLRTLLGISVLLMRTSLVFVFAERFLADTEWDEPTRLLVVGRIKFTSHRGLGYAYNG